MPAIASVDALERAAAGFEVTDLDVDAEPTALAAARRSLADPGLLLLGEVHGVRETPLLCRSLMMALGATGLALEWDEDLAPVIDEYSRGGPLRDHRTLWSGDGRITAGHLAVLREGRAAGWLRALTLFDGTLDQDWDWSSRDAAMARRVLAADRAAGGTLVVAGNAHTRTVPTDLGVPLGAKLAERHPGILEVRIRYGGGGFYNGEPRRFTPNRLGGPRGGRRLQLRHGDGELVLILPQATEAVVPQRPRPWEAAGAAR